MYGGPRFQRKGTPFAVFAAIESLCNAHPFLRDIHAILVQNEAELAAHGERGQGEHRRQYAHRNRQDESKQPDVAIMLAVGRGKLLALGPDKLCGRGHG